MNVETINSAKELISFFFENLNAVPAVQYMFLSRVLSVFGAIIGVVVVLWKASSELRKTRRIARERQALDFEFKLLQNVEHKKNTLTLLTVLKSSLVNGNRHCDNCNGLRINKIVNYETTKKIMRDIDLKSRAGNLLNLWELCANGIKEGLLDEPYLYKVHATTVIHIYSVFNLYIKIRQKASPAAYISLEWLAKKWIIERMRCRAMEKSNVEVIKQIKSLDSLMKANSKFRIWNLMRKIDSRTR